MLCLCLTLTGRSCFCVRLRSSLDMWVALKFKKPSNIPHFHKFVSFEILVQEPKFPKSELKCPITSVNSSNLGENLQTWQHCCVRLSSFALVFHMHISISFLSYVLKHVQEVFFFYYYYYYIYIQDFILV